MGSYIDDVNIGCSLEDVPGRRNQTISDVFGGISEGYERDDG
jgi:hypothetical protein